MVLAHCSNKSCNFLSPKAVSCLCDGCDCIMTDGDSRKSEGNADETKIASSEILYILEGNI